MDSHFAKGPFAHGGTFLGATVKTEDAACEPCVSDLVALRSSRDLAVELNVTIRAIARDGIMRGTVFAMRRRAESLRLFDGIAIGDEVEIELCEIVALVKCRSA
ncbi:hypothetical protein [Cupriavidus sp. D39]|uniref:hypothetical protein n=1 Tax=Cupriavidus sp. D39 TaxID=2997877 RepID=UPI00226DF217|nr:hypothetical protein [Cupriavidus sp. D39]MCY0853352.1 hypothetical protein [Cupriavidus sp. D39]